MARTAPAPNIPPIPGMCPSLAVMGGGGSGGGGSGKGAGGGDGSGGADGDGSADGANADGSGSGTCGNGSGASCTNCSSGTAAGDPVDCVTGEVFTLPKTDLFLPGPFDLKIDRRYSSFSRKHDVGLGWGWSHSLAWRGEIKRDRIVIHTGRGQAVAFPVLEVGELAAIKGWGLLRTKDAYVLRAGDEFMHVLSEDPEAPTGPGLKAVLRLRRIQFRNRGAIELAYDRGSLVRVRDAAGRVVQLARGGDGRIASIVVAEPGGASIVFARYRYDAVGNLVEAVDADGHAWTYDYDDDRRLIRMAVPKGPTFHFCYDKEGRCVETWGARPDGAPDPALAPDVPDVLADGVTKAKGIYHVKLEFGPDGYSEAVDSVRVQRFFAGPGGKAAKAVNGRGGVTSRAYDAAGNIVAHCDANGATWRYKYDELGNVVESTDPEDRVLRFERDGEGRLTKVVDARGGVIEYGIDKNGNTEWSRDQKGALHQMRYDDRGLLKEEIRADGTRIKIERDAMGNVVARTLGNGAVQRYTYDYWGRMVKERLADGRELAYRYSPSGRVVEVTDNTGRVKSYEYDPLGNIVSDRLPDGAVTHYDRGGLGWLAAVRFANGQQIRRYHNREGWLVSVENERGERHEIRYNASGAVVGERTFDGVERSAVRDARDHIVQIVEPDGKTFIERNKVGQIVKMVGKDGEEKEYVYDAAGQLVGATSGGTAIVWERDPTGKIVKEQLTVGGASYSIETERDILGRRVGMKTSLGHEVETRRDALGEVSAIVADGDEVERFGRDPTGWLTRRDLGGGGAILDEIDAAGRLRRRLVQTAGAPQAAPDGQPDWVGGLPPGQVDKTYQYTPISELASVTTTAGGTVEYEYDLRRHLVERRGRFGEEKFGYDDRGNPFEAGPDAPPRRYAEGSRLLSRGDAEYEHDARGRVVEKRVRRQDGRVERTRYAYDAWNLLRAVDLPDARRVEFSYDAFARRLEKRVLATQPSGRTSVVSTTHYVWDLVSVVHQIERRPAQSDTVSTYLYEDHSAVVPLAQRANGSDWAHYVHGVNGTPEEIVDGRGQELGASTRSAYGRVTWSSSSKATTPFRFPGQIEDPETGLHYNRYRTYDPETGRYLTHDPIELEGGMNLYAYGPNPIAWIDPMGWQHHMDVSGPDAFGSFARLATGGDVNAGYDSGYHGLGTEANPHELRSQARCHTEQRFAHDLIHSGRRWDGEEFELTGSLPPCPNCHRALQHAADRTGANITYNWTDPVHGPQSISYSPNAAPVGDGNLAEPLTAAYGMTADSSRRNGYRFESWSGASAAYTAASAGDVAFFDD